MTAPDSSNEFPHSLYYYNKKKNLNFSICCQRWNRNASPVSRDSCGDGCPPKPTSYHGAPTHCILTYISRPITNSSVKKCVIFVPPFFSILISCSVPLLQWSTNELAIKNEARRKNEPGLRFECIIDSGSSRAFGRRLLAFVVPLDSPVVISSRLAGSILRTARHLNNARLICRH